MLITKFSQMARLGILARSIFTLGICAGLTIPASAQITYEGGKAASQPTTGNFNIPVSEGKQTGGNLFHSFGTFGVPTNGSANFEANSSVQNILGRVTGGAPSLVDGKLQVTGGNANLFLMNPAGIVFGKGASLDINGAFTATTAKAIGFDNGQWFNALGGNNYPAGNPVNFAFTNTPGSIFNAANLATKPGKSITLIGGTVISTGDIKTTGGNISVATVEGGKYVQIITDGMITRYDLPTADKDQIQNTPNPDFTPPSLAALLTGNDNKVRAEATGIAVDSKTGAVRLVSDNPLVSDRLVSTGDISTKLLDTSSDRNSRGNVSLDNQVGNIIIGAIDARIIGPISPNGGGNVNIKTQGVFQATGFVQPGSLKIRTQDRNGNLISNAASGVSILTSAAISASNAILTSTDLLLSNSLSGGEINIKYKAPFIFGGKSQVLPDSTEVKPYDILITLTQPFSFPQNTSGSVGAISISTQSIPDQGFGTVYADGPFVSFTGDKTNGFQFDAAPPSDGSGKNRSNPDEQASRPKSKENCTPSSTAVAANPTTAPTRSAGNANAVSADPCQQNTSNSGILQILNDRN